MAATEESILTILSNVCKNDEVMKNPDVDLFESGLLDSFGVVELILAFDQELGIEIPISEFDREEWNTPRKIVEKLKGYAA